MKILLYIYSDILNLRFWSMVFLELIDGTYFAFFIFYSNIVYLIERDACLPGPLLRVRRVGVEVVEGAHVSGFSGRRLLLVVKLWQRPGMGEGQ